MMAGMTGEASIPQPEIVSRGPSRFGDTARYHCPRGCGWWHDEPTDPGPKPLRVPVDFTPADLSAAITANAEAQGRALCARVEQALAEHLRSHHPDA
jgi:hypothetical protein